MNKKKQSEYFLLGEGDLWFKNNFHPNGDDSEKYKCEDPILKIINKIDLPDNIETTVAEVGMGQGLRLQDLKEKRRWTTLGVDPSQEAVNYASQFLDKSFLGTANNLPFESDSIDVLIFGFCLYLCDRSDLFLITSEANRVLKKKSWLAIVDFWTPYPQSNQYKDRKNIRSYKLNLNSMFTWHPDYEIYEHNLQKWQTKKYTDDINEWVASTLIRKNSKN